MSWCKKEAADMCLRLSVFKMNRDGIFESPAGTKWTFAWGDEERKSIGVIILPGMTGIRLMYTRKYAESDRTVDCDYVVPLTTTPCYFGGVRFWFRCPIQLPDGTSCFRRVGKLYLPWSEHIFGCRHCHDLSYLSRQSRWHRDRNNFTKLLSILQDDEEL